LIDLATTQANAQSEARDEKEVAALQEAYGKGATGRGMATGGAKAVKDLEKDQKSRATRMVRDSLDGALLDIATFFRDVMMVQAGSTDSLINTDMTEQITAYAHKTTPHSTVRKVNAIMKARTHLSHNAAPLLTIEALMCQIAN
jgi:DNA polymerase-3 subunit delta'